jgi:hypothetical protein
VHGHDAAWLHLPALVLHGNILKLIAPLPRGSGKGNLRSRLDLPLERSMADTAEIVVIGASHGNREQVPLVQQAEK